MKKIITILGLILFIFGCNSENKKTLEPPKQVANTANCPKDSQSELPIKIPSREGNFYDTLNYRIDRIVADADTIAFKTPNANFILCRANNNWTISEPSSEEKSQRSQDIKEYYAQLANPPYQEIDINGKKYQFRAVLEPNPFPNFKQEPERVTFEIIKPGKIEPEKTVLYTLEQIQKQQLGVNLGVPKLSLEIPEVIAYLYYGDNVISSNIDNPLIWSVSPEQGEGNAGIATIISYDFEADKVTLIQPEAIKGQQINDIAITGKDRDNPTLWIATQIAGEGNPNLPGMGLVAYDLHNKTTRSYRVDNSAIVGAIPTQLKVEKDRLWIVTGNGICQVNWQTIDNNNSWNCWRFALMAKLPPEGLPIYRSSLDNNVANIIKPNKDNDAIEILWWNPKNLESRNGRYEVRYEEGFTVKLDRIGYSSWQEFYPPNLDFKELLPVWNPPIYWLGKEWHWQGSKFVRGFDEVGLNLVGLGPVGISSQKFDPKLGQDRYAIRGDLDLIELTKTSTEVKYYSAWTEDTALQPSLTIAPVELPKTVKPNPLKEFADR
ncbi:MAG: hypothetical protein QNJ38_18040 [Prochloraceae cyanobacterium]|nr:hypothetical protein [Prochloraceae cyanobacterium]